MLDGCTRWPTDLAEQYRALGYWQGITLGDLLAQTVRRFPHKVLLLAGSCDEDPRRERELIGSFRDRRVDGIIVVPASQDHTYLYVEQRAGTRPTFFNCFGIACLCLRQDRK